jgi:tagatose 1,6-diphosphate aldolase GatY/KbaY
MLISTLELLRAADRRNYAVGAFNIYNLEGVLAVVAAASENHSPAILQIHPAAMNHSGHILAALCLNAAQQATVPISLQFDHGTSSAQIQSALKQGFTSVMFDGSELPYWRNLQGTLDLARLAHSHGVAIEAELGRLSGTEDGVNVPEYTEKLTEPVQAIEFVERTGVDALAVCIGNVHGPYLREPKLDFDRLRKIRDSVRVPLVLHGASGLPETMVHRSIELGVRKFNVNTEVREAYIDILRTRLATSSTKRPDLGELMREAVMAMQVVVSSKLRLFGSVGMADFDHTDKAR